MFTPKELTRYSRNIFLDEIGRVGQELLKKARVGIIGTGGLGSPVLLYLAASGVGNITLIDSDVVELTNLQRQILFNTKDLKKSKSKTAHLRLSELNPEINIVSHETRLCRTNIQELLSGHDIILEGSDNFETKFLVNDFCFFQKIPLIVAGILRFDGQVLGILPETGFCYRCIFPEIPSSGLIPSCAEAGVLGSVAGVIGSLQATECLKFLIGAKETIMGKLLQVDLRQIEFRKLLIKKNPNCKLCGENRTIMDLSIHPEFDVNC
ncbi:MAG: HesA/MoeB/ThiF family protein [Leptospiraceae bacterium]|nr:HesA/MoeB/ThiF family protein [Leptospiraceae bacterium]